MRSTTARTLTGCMAIVMCLLVAACATNVSRFQMPGTELSDVRALYVRPLAEERAATELQSLLEASLRQRGLQVAVYSESVELEAGDFILDVAADWHWDIAWYLLELRVAIYEPKNNTLVAQAQSLQSSLVRQSNEVVVERALASLFNDTE